MTRKMLFVDDERSLECELPDYRIDYARTVDDAVGMWIVNKYDEIWLDHDLGEDGGDIMNFVAALMRYGDYNKTSKENGYGWELPDIVVHSMNPVGAENIVGKLSPYYNVKRIPYSIIISDNDGIGYV